MALVLLQILDLIAPQSTSTNSISNLNTKVKLCGKNGVPSDIYPISNPIDVFNFEYDTDYLVGMEIRI